MNLTKKRKEKNQKCKLNLRSDFIKSSTQKDATCNTKT